MGYIKADLPLFPASSLHLHHHTHEHFGPKLQPPVPEYSSPYNYYLFGIAVVIIIHTFDSLPLDETASSSTITSPPRHPTNITTLNHQSPLVTMSTSTKRKMPFDAPELAWQRRRYTSHLTPPPADDGSATTSVDDDANRFSTMPTLATAAATPTAATTPTPTPPRTPSPLPVPTQSSTKAPPTCLPTPS